MNLNRFRKKLAKMYLDLAEAYARVMEFERAKEYIDKAVQLLESDSVCLECLEKRAENLLSIIKELKKVIA